jgi:hypothetical protein
MHQRPPFLSELKRHYGPVSHWRLTIVSPPATRGCGATLFLAECRVFLRRLGDSSGSRWILAFRSAGAKFGFRFLIRVHHYMADNFLRSSV